MLLAYLLGAPFTYHLDTVTVQESAGGVAPKIT